MNFLRQKTYRQMEILTWRVKFMWGSGGWPQMILIRQFERCEQIGGLNLKLLFQIVIKSFKPANI